jgi:hypothetical protein
MVCLRIIEKLARVTICDMELLYDITTFLWIKGLWMHMEKPLPPDIQDMTSSISHFRVFGSSTRAHIPIYSLYDPSSTNAIFDAVSIHRSTIFVPVFLIDDSSTVESQHLQWISSFCIMMLVFSWMY